MSMSFDNEEFSKEIQPTIERLKELQEQINSSFQRFYQSDAFEKLVEIFSSLPSNVKETEMYKKTKDLSQKNNYEIHLEDVEWIPKKFDLNSASVVIANLREQHYKDDTLEGYITRLILNESLQEKEKLVILLAHMEPLIYKAIGKVRKPYGSIKEESKSYAKEHENGKMNSFYAVYILAITYTIFANTDNYRNLDKRVPFRNYILHNGIVGYSDTDAKTAYEFLIECISVLLITGGDNLNSKFEQSIFVLNE